MQFSSQRAGGNGSCQSYYRGTCFFPFKDQNVTTCSSCALAFPKYADEQHFLCVFSSAGTRLVNQQSVSIFGKLLLLF